jgi:hypothetical protein
VRTETPNRADTACLLSKVLIEMGSKWLEGCSIGVTVVPVLKESRVVTGIYLPTLDVHQR